MQGTLIPHTADENVDFSVSASLSKDGKTVVLTVVNRYASAQNVWIELPGMESMTVKSLSGALNAVNTADTPNKVAIGEAVPCEGQLAKLPANSVNVITITVK